MPPPTTSTSTAAGSLAPPTGDGRGQNGVPSATFPATASRLVAWSLALSGLLADAILLVLHFSRRPYDADFRNFYATALLGRKAGWAHIYDIAAQARIADVIGPGHDWPYLNPPLLAWLAAPFTFLPYVPAALLWSAVLIALLGLALVAARPGPRLPWYLASIALAFPFLFGVEQGQVIALLALSLVLCHRFDRSGHPFLAGAVLGLTLLKPHVVFLVPVVLLLAGRLRVFVAWTAICLVVAALTVTSLGVEGMAAWYQSVAAVRAQVPAPHFTLAFWLPGIPGLAAGAVVAAGTLAVAWRSRDESTARILALGVVGSALASPYLNIQDLALLVVAGWLLWQEINRAEKLLLGLGWIGVAASAGTGLPVLAVESSWLASAVARTASRTREGALPASQR
jgi:hypothetical protein